MAIKDWPRPVRRAIGWTLVVLAFAVAFLPAAIVALVARDSIGEQLSWSRLLGGYALLVTVPTTLVVAGFIALQLLRDKRFTFAVSILMGTTVGIVVGLVLGLVTGGYSLLSAPAIGLVTFLIAWAVQSVRGKAT